MINDTGANQYLCSVEQDQASTVPDPIERAVAIIEAGLEQGIWLSGIMVGEKVHLVQLSFRRTRFH
jgi:hypothetical protein